MMYNLVKTARQGKFEASVEAAAAPLAADHHGPKESVTDGSSGNRRCSPSLRSC